MGVEQGMGSAAIPQGGSRPDVADDISISIYLYEIMYRTSPAAAAGLWPMG